MTQLSKRKNGNLAEVLRRLRRRARLKQEAMAAELGVTQATYSRMECGQIAITTDRLEQIAGVLGKRPAELMDAASALAAVPAG